ncbi:MAG: MiaB/RimO family radical SAM methylthiotransferase [Coriobacteriia bacterium]|nr:MiaB/RimO family radical SAM methylthiotransferase [Coriobacteriia bacterium]
MPEGAAPRVAFVTLGCKVNQAETDTIASVLPGTQVVRQQADADIIVINTCTVTGEADHKARKAVRHALGQPGNPTVIVTGCLAAIDPAGVAALGERVIAEPDKERVRACLAELAGATGTPTTGRATSRARVQLKVEDGCDAFCSYCIIPYARGVPRAVPLTEIVTAAAALAAEGVAEVVLAGINIGRYEDRGATLADVLEAVAATGVPRVRISSIEPGDIDDRLLEAAARTPAFCRHLHVPLQSGSDAVLVRMGRPYTTAGFADRVAAAREALPGVAISTDVIAGFPGETDAEHAQTLESITASGFSRLHVFRYSARAGTPAAAMAGQVPPPVRAARAAELRAAGERLAGRAASAASGHLAELLVERVRPGDDDGSRRVEGTTREYLHATAVHTSAVAGDLLTVRLGGLTPTGAIESVVESPRYGHARSTQSDDQRQREAQGPST